VGSLSDLRAHFAAVQENWDDWFSQFAAEAINDYVTGREAAQLFDGDVDTLDALFLLARLERDTLPYLIHRQALAAADDGFSRNEIAAALGVSRQAATKRWHLGHRS
jgi:hypothetical protein